MMAPIFKKLAREKAGEAVFIKIDTNAQHELAGRYGVRSIPTFVFFHGGRKHQEFSGAGEGQLRQFTDAIIGRAKDENVRLTLDSLSRYYAEHDAGKDADAVQGLLNKCAGSVQGKGKGTSSGNATECVGASAYNLARKLKRKYKKGPQLVPRFDAAAAAANEEDGDRNRSNESSSSSTTKTRSNNSSNDTAADAKTANLALATMTELQDEIERRMDELRDAEADDETDDDDDPHAFQRTSPWPQPLTIIGGGPAGLSAAIYAARSGLAPVVIAPPMGGQLLSKGVDVENYPGMTHVTGPEVVSILRAQAIEFGTTFEADTVTRVDTGVRPFQVHLRGGGAPIATHAIIVATGAESNWLGIPGEYELRGGGVSSCAICDGA